jgi:hypothetical protein
MNKLEFKDPTNLGEIAALCGKVSADLYKRTLEPKVAKEITNSNGKFINACRAYNEFCAERGEKPDAPQFKMG